MCVARCSLKLHANVDPNLAMIIKQRKKAGEVATMDLVGSVEGSDAIIVDDMIDTAGTLCKAAQELKKHGGTLARCRGDASAAPVH